MRERVRGGKRGKERKRQREEEEKGRKRGLLVKDKDSLQIS